MQNKLRVDAQNIQPSAARVKIITNLHGPHSAHHIRVLSLWQTWDNIPMTTILIISLINW